MTDIESALADGRPVIRCGCGFFAISEDQSLNVEALNMHACPNAYEEVETEGESRWYHHVFSFWGYAIAIAAALALMQIFGSGK